MQTVFTIILIFIYGSLGAYVWGFWRNRPSESYPLRQELVVLMPALLLHAFLVWSPLLGSNILLFQFGNALSMIAWLMLLIYCGGSFFYQLKGLQILLYPLAALALFLSLIFPGNGTMPLLYNPHLILHVGTSILAYCLFAIATLLAILIILLERDLHRHRMSALMHFLPPLLSLEKLMFQTIVIGFILLTLAVAGGAFFSELLFYQPFRWTHKSVFGIVAWLIYALLLWLRFSRSWRGQRAAWWIIVGFASLMLAYVGSKFIIEIILS